MLPGFGAAASNGRCAVVFCAVGRRRKNKVPNRPRHSGSRGERLGPYGRFTHEIALPTLIAVVALAGIASTAAAETMDGHAIVAPQDIKWGPAPAVLPPGAEAAVLFGDPSKEGLFALRLKLPAGYSVPPHTHSVDEVVTVFSGTFSLGTEETVDQSTAQGLPAGSFLALPPGTAHYVFIDE